jgi:guanylate kinase
MTGVLEMNGNSGGLLMVVSAPSGAGKTSICRAVMEMFPEIVYSVSYTTRPPRPGEVDGRDYRFVSGEEFRAGIARGDFIEWNEVYGHLYGTSGSDIRELLGKNRDIILDLDTGGAVNLKKIFPEGIYIFISPPSLEELKKRLSRRGSEDAGTLKTRLGNALEEMKAAFWYDYVIFNKDLPVAVEQFKSIYLAEKCRRDRLEDKLRKIMKELEE